MKRTHGLSGKNNPEYEIWCAIRQRCNNPRCKQYARYGAKGVRVSSAWDTFEAFLKDVGPRPSKYHSIDRINVLGDYEPGNVRWTNRLVQNRNTRRALTQSLPLHVRKRSNSGFTVRIRGNTVGTYKTKLEAVFSAMNHDITYPRT